MNKKYSNEEENIEKLMDELAEELKRVTIKFLKKNYKKIEKDYLLMIVTSTHVVSVFESLFYSCLIEDKDKNKFVKEIV